MLLLLNSNSFKGYSNLMSINILDNVTSISNSIFYRNYIKLTEVIISNFIITIGNFAFLLYRRFVH